MPDRMHPTKVSSFLTLTLASLLYTCTTSFTSSDNYLVDCGSSENTTVGMRNFVGDAHRPYRPLSNHASIMANTTTNSVASFDGSSLYQTMRVFTGPSSYSFQIQQQGRHFIRLHFYPFVYQNYDLATAKFSVSTQDITLLTGFQSNNITVPMLKEYLVNIKRNILTLSFVPFSDLAFVNAIEVVSVPDNLIVDWAQTINPVNEYVGLSGRALKTVYRVNMGIPKVTPDNDALWRSWVPDVSFIQNSNHTKWVCAATILDCRDGHTAAEIASSDFPKGAGVGVIEPADVWHPPVHDSTDAGLNSMEGFGTQETAPSVVYDTATKLVSSNMTTIGAGFKMTWLFDLQEGCTYMLRFHFCDIVSESSDPIVFDVYVGQWAILTNFNISFLTNGRSSTPLFRDFILSAKDSLIGLV